MYVAKHSNITVILIGFLITKAATVNANPSSNSISDKGENKDTTEVLDPSHNNNGNEEDSRKGIVSEGKSQSTSHFGIYSDTTTRAIEGEGTSRSESSPKEIATRTTEMKFTDNLEVKTTRKRQKKRTMSYTRSTDSITTDEVTTLSSSKSAYYTTEYHQEMFYSTMGEIQGSICSEICPVLQKATVKIVPRALTVEEGSDIEFVCRTDINVTVSYVELTWRGAACNSLTIFDHYNASDNYTNQIQWTLFNATSDCSGIYICELRHKGGCCPDVIQSAHATLTVYEIPSYKWELIIINSFTLIVIMLVLLPLSLWQWRSSKKRWYLVKDEDDDPHIFQL